MVENGQKIKDEARDMKPNLGEMGMIQFHLCINLAKLVKEKVKEVVELKQNG